MPYNNALTLKVANRGDFSTLLIVLMALSLLSASLSAQPVLLILVSIVVFGAGWFEHILHSSKVSDMNLISIILPDGQVRIKLHGESKIEGYMCGQQWCTSHVAVLRYKSEEGRLRYRVFLRRQQHSNDYRRLRVWLRHDYRNDTGNKHVSGMAR